MSAHSRVEVGDHAMLWVRESWIPEVAALFTEDQLICDEQHLGYVATATQIRDRLRILGFTLERARHNLEHAVSRWNSVPKRDTTAGAAEERTALLVSDLRRMVNTPNDEEHWSQIADYEEPAEFHLAPRAALRLAVECEESAAVSVRYNLDDLQAYRLLRPRTPITDQARQERTQEVTTDAPLVILTEGSSDSQLLTAALQVTHPHLVGFLKFMDFGGGAEGSVNTLPRLIRSFVGAGIVNRVLALADNDTAAHDALAKLKQEGLPDGYRILHYPPLELLAAYPTLGPQSDEPVVMDVNGAAGGLEMYLGRDLLTVDGALSPVQWTGYVESRHAYQGALVGGEKNRIQRAFRRKVGVALADPNARAEQDWTGVEEIIELILTAHEAG